MSLKRVLSPLKAARSDIEFSITALTACSALEMIVQKPEKYVDCELSSAISRGAKGVQKITERNSSLHFISDRALLRLAEDEINNKFRKQEHSHKISIESFYKNQYHFYFIHFLIILMNDYAGHCVSRAREGVSRLSMEDTVRFNSACRNMVIGALRDNKIDSFLLDPMELRLVDWATLEARRK